ncbi:type II toxin-antitoxin system antitoxin SocA domain-containing protein [Asticcacaulis sp. EMRT-3]|uniref:Panacea domain-containing protein n=1 Tax=Asticcacaulis sp. EMRT-3 TaxID=3040349 RepID=UPI0024AFA5DE|nr:type II toxin-antitoxin system antitoxin SocA domain-containing protein [Asticcacaulis sp. EMRT-3]MDI7773962.1 DUF4065 domain-containing protein [Asticcacaulis sp. EMRT-3]
MSFDVRAVANFVLDLADKLEQPVTNMHINKIVYFLHADYLVAFDAPLVTAKIEAWTHGPVFRELYREFKDSGESKITKRATYLDPITGEKRKAECSFHEEEEKFLVDLVKRYVLLSASALRSHSHIENGPWDKVWNHEGRANASMRISDQSIKDWYGRTVRH